MKILTFNSVSHHSNDPKEGGFWNIFGKEENAGNQHFLLFPKVFLLFPKPISIFFITFFFFLFFWRYASALNLHRSKTFFLSYRVNWNFQADSKNSEWCYQYFTLSFGLKDSFTTQSPLLTALKKEIIVGKGENAGNQHFLLFLQCFLLIPKIISF